MKSKRKTGDLCISYKIGGYLWISAFSASTKMTVNTITPVSLLLSVGPECADDLISDLKNAFEEE